MTADKPPARTDTHDDVEPPTFFALRTPLLAHEWLAAWSEDLAAPRVRDPEALGDALARDRDALVRGLLAQAEHRAVRDAILCASPTLDEALEARRTGAKSSRAEGTIPILVRYLVRMTSRCTPFGLFSGCSFGRIREATRLDIPERSQLVRHSRLDMHYLTALVEAIELEPELREHLSFRTNPAIYRTAGQLRYPEARTHPETRVRSHHLVSVEVSDALEVAMTAAAAGASMSAIAQAIAASDPEVSVDEALGFVHELVDSQVLVSSLAPPVTGLEPMPALTAKLQEAGPRGREVATVLADVGARIDAIDAGGVGASRDAYEAVAESLRALPAKVELKRLFQVDLYKPSDALSVGPAVVDEIIRGIDLLRTMATPTVPGELATFRSAFAHRFESSRVKLTEALDEERGIRFGSGGAEPSPLLEDFVFPPRGPEATGSFRAKDRWLLRRYSRLIASQAGEWELDDDDVKALTATAKGDLPDAFAVFGALEAESAEAVDRGEFSFTLGLSGPSGALLLGRFCHGDPELARAVQEHLRAEEALRPEAVFAEIVHLPEGRLGNILCRPVLRDYEIPYLCASAVPAERQIPIEDLSVFVAGDRIVLWSERLDREVVPRLTNAHNFDASTLGIYRFLSRLQHQDAKSYLGWDWGALSDGAYLPRVRRGRFILSLARWNLSSSDIEPLRKSSGAELFRAAGDLRERLGLPRHVALADSDNVIPIDFDNILSLETFAPMLKHRSSVLLREIFPSPNELCARGPEGRFTNELVVPFIRKREPSPAARRPALSTLKRHFGPGSEWLYVKLYAGSATIDPLIADMVHPIARDALERGLVDSWFFIRYGDPDWHLRVRFRGGPSGLAELRGRLDDEIARALDRGILHRAGIDTYQREIERYGGDRGMELCEELFHHDSEAIAELVALYSGDEGADARWRLALLGMHLTLVDLGLDLDERVGVMTDVRRGFGAEFNVNVYFEKQLGTRFRKERKSLEELVRGGGLPDDHPLSPGVSVLKRRSANVALVASELRSRGQAGELTSPLPDIAASLLHMHANRTLVDEARAQELILYDYLLRVYESQRARERKAKPKPSAEPGSS